MKPKVVRLILGAAIALTSPLATLRAQFAYVANLNSNNVSAYSIGSGGVLQRETVPRQWRWIPPASSPT